MATSTRRALIRGAALYVRISTSDKGQSVENQLQPLQEAAGRLGWTVVAIHTRSGRVGRQRPSEAKQGVDPDQDE